MPKIILILITVFTVNNAFSQMKSNIIDFDKVKINNIKLVDLMVNNDAINLKIKKIEGEKKGSIYYFYDGLDMSYNMDKLSFVNITNNKIDLTILDKKIKVGDNINKLGTVYYNNLANGSRSIVFQGCKTCNNLITVRFNQRTKQIEKIMFIDLPFY